MDEMKWQRLDWTHAKAVTATIADTDTSVARVTREVGGCGENTKPGKLRISCFTFAAEKILRFCDELAKNGGSPWCDTEGFTDQFDSVRYTPELAPRCHTPRPVSPPRPHTGWCIEKAQRWCCTSNRAPRCS